MELVETNGCYSYKKIPGKMNVHTNIKFESDVTDILEQSNN